MSTGQSVQLPLRMTLQVKRTQSLTGMGREICLLRKTESALRVGE